MRNQAMFYRIAQIIEQMPQQHDQEGWFGNLGTGDSNDTEKRMIGNEEYTCGTTQCVAGWAIVLDRRLKGFENDTDGLTVALVEDSGGVTVKLRDSDDYSCFAAEILGLDEYEAYELFFTTDTGLDWPNILRDIGNGANVREVLMDAYH